MSKGVILIANNNSFLDYVKQSVFAAKKIKEHLNVPVSVITDSSDYLKENFDHTIFDKIISFDDTNTNKRIMFDNNLNQKTVDWKNTIRTNAYNLTPYDETLLIDSDFIINNNLLGNVFNCNYDLMLYKKSYSLSQDANSNEFCYISDTSIEFYWATVVFFKKNKKTAIFFDLINHIKQEWDHYVRIYRLQSNVFRNDFAFSIAVHILNGFQKGDLVQELPGKLYYTSGKEFLVDHSENKMTFLLTKKENQNEYTLMKTEGLNVHVMNKISLEKIIDKEEKNV